MRTDEVTYWNVQMMKRWRKTPAASGRRDRKESGKGSPTAALESAEPASPEYAAAVIDCIQQRARLQPGDTCLDLGGGAASLALPLARRVSLVTACDATAQKLQDLEAQARQQGLANVITLSRRWLDVEPFWDVGPHDIVIAHCPLGAISCDRNGTPDFVKCLSRIHELTRRAAFIIPPAFSLPDDGGFRTLFPECAGGPPVRFSDLTTVNLLHAMGLFPRLEYQLLRQTHRFHSIDGEVAEFRRVFQLDGLRRLKRLGDYLARSAVRQDDGYALRTVTRLMIIWWSKDA
jgi:hypothetical protein